MLYGVGFYRVYTRFLYFILSKMETIKKIQSWKFTIEVCIRLKDKEQENFNLFQKLKKPVFSVSAMVWKGKKEDCAGQCLDYVNEILEQNGDLTKERATIYYLRKKHHLNDLHAGTEKQEEYLKQARGFLTDYSDQCDALDKAGLLVDNGYKYWSWWLYRPIPDEDLREIKKLFY